jgi:myxalamid-type polyketide synthase MxaE and MxaD
MSNSLEHDNLSPVKRALLELKRMQSKLDTIERARTEPLAVIGMGCRFPGRTNSPQDYWELLKNGVDGIVEVPANRWNVDDYYDPDPGAPGKMNTRWGGFLERVDLFDAHFFGISPREASRMDPQQRLVLEVAWDALERAGQTAEQISGSRTGVFVGLYNADFCHFQAFDPSLIDPYTALGNSHSVTANRVSYLLNLQGPSVAVDTACSSSLVGVHLACQSLRNNECDMALAAGINVMLLPHATMALSSAGTLAPDGRCKSFDARADGIVLGEGCGVVVLKRLSDAQAAGDPILALIRGSAVNQDGRTNGLTAPNVLSQQAVIRQALANAGVSPGQVSYVEAHGTGTVLGDPIEVEALAEVFGKPGANGQPCTVSSVKTNFGHLEAAAGIAGLMKVVLSLQHEAIPPNLHFQKLNPYIRLEGTRLEIAADLRQWPANAHKRLAGISSFGFGGTNAHVVLEEAPTPEATVATPAQAAGDAAYLLPISARSETALRELAAAYVPLLQTTTEASALRDLCYTAALRRSHHEHRLALAAHNGPELAQQLEAFLQGEAPATLALGQAPPAPRPKPVFVFSGQGGQWLGMGRQLLDQEPVFRQTLEQCDELLRSHVDWSLLAELQATEADSQLVQIDVVQPLLFALQVALAELWRSWGVQPVAVVGHSLGELAAAYVAGILTLADALRIICVRSKLLKRLSGQGAMAVVELSFDEATQAIAEQTHLLAVGVSNSRHSTVLSGDPAALAQLLQRLEHDGIFCRLIKSDVAGHSPQVDPLLPELKQTLSTLQPQAGRLRMQSTVSGENISGPELTADYWVRNLREPVRFASAIERLTASGHDLFIEISPHPVLLPAISEVAQEQAAAQSRPAPVVVASLRRERDERLEMLHALAQLHCAGQPVNWSHFFPNGGRCVSLPAYPWQRQRYWIEEDEGQDVVKRPSAGPIDNSHGPLLGRQLRSALKQIQFETVISADWPAYLHDHTVFGVIVFPASGYVEMALSAASAIFGAQAATVEDLVIHNALVLDQESKRALQFVLNSEEAGQRNFEIFSAEIVDGNEPMFWIRHASGSLLTDPPAADSADTTLDEIRERCQQQLSVPDFYQQLSDHGLQYGPNFQGVKQLWRSDDGEALGQIRLSDDLTGDKAVYRTHPALLDACLQVLGASVSPDQMRAGGDQTYLPVSIKALRLYQQPPVDENIWCHARQSTNEETEGEEASGDLLLYAESGVPLIEIKGLTLKRVGGELLRHSINQNVKDWQYEIEWKPMNLDQELKPSESGAKVRQPGCWLVFSDQQGVGENLQHQLQQQGQECVLVFPGSSYRQTDPTRYEVDATSADDFRRLFSELIEERQLSVQSVVHLWGLDAPEEAATPDALAAAQQQSCGSVLYLVQALAFAPDAARLWLVTRNAQAVSPLTTPVAVAQASLWGMGRVISLEHPELKCTMVDLPDAVTGQEAAAILLTELDAADGEDQIALRDSQRYVARLRRSQSEPLLARTSQEARTNEEARTSEKARTSQEGGNAPAEQQERGPGPLPDCSVQPLAINPTASYLITGGLGGLGLLVADWLVQQGARHLVLLSRREFHSEITTIQALESQGATVRVVQADVANLDQLNDLFEDLKNDPNPLRGIIHAAGVLADGLLLNQDWDHFKIALAPKVLGAWNLHTLTADTPLDFFVMFSSVAAVLGSPGQANHAAANAFLDALAHHRRARGLAGVSINWGVWSEIGAAAGPIANKFATMPGIGVIAPAQGLSVLQQVCERVPAQVAVLPINWELWRALGLGSSAPPLVSDLIQELSGSHPQGTQESMLTRAQLLELPPAERLPTIEDYLSKQVSRVLRLPVTTEFDVRQPLTAMGMDSLMAIELRTRIHTDLGLILTIKHFLEGPTVAKLAALLLDQIIQEELDHPAPASIAGSVSDEEYEVIKI